MSRKRARKVRVSLRKNRQKRSRLGDLTRRTLTGDAASDDKLHQSAAERLTGKGDLTRRRTILSDEQTADGDVLRAVDLARCREGRVISATGLNCIVADASGRRLQCTVRRMIRTLARDERSAVVAGDVVLFQPIDAEHAVIERVNPRRTTLGRATRRKEQIIASNVDQALVVVSAAQPALKSNLVDRLLISAHKGGVRPIICINKIDLIDVVKLQPVVGMYARLGYDILLTSAETGAGLRELQRLLKGRETVATGQSGVGKSSLLNALQPGLVLDTGDVSSWTHKGRHTTRVARLLPLDFGGWIVDTPGIRQMDLWNVQAAEVEEFYVEFRPFVAGCRFPDCSHIHERDCAVKSAVERDLVSPLRYASYLKIMAGEAD